MNELSKKEALLPSCPITCPTGCAGKSGVQCVEVSQPVVLTPRATVGTITTSCPGVPTVSCVTDETGSFCTVTLTQRVCVTIPVSYGATAEPGTPTIACGGSGDSSL